PGAALAALALEPVQHRLFLAALDPGGAGALEALELAGPVLHRVLPAADGAGVLDLDLLVLGAGLLDDLDEIAQVLAYHRVLPGGDVLELVVQSVAVGAARVAGHHDEVTGLARVAGQAPVLPLPGGHLVLGIL